ncbi:MAG TPA: acetyl-CoA carboxylase biotin carboxyl carrier protein subunit [Anaerolineales bacterium]|jgi:biotin carboxyl carrier protein|nr:acetyl-CoA carboxylase biotin carboxyl carrier protein subunit [Anaerolineales bacterium]
MKYIVKVADKSYEVEIEDIHARPVIARVDGQKFEVSPETGDGSQQVSKTETKEFKPVQGSRQPSSASLGAKELTAPLPGTVIEVFVKPGDIIESGQVILIIEAMKMKNSIRSTRAGTITDVLISAGQTVAHKQTLVRFAD